MKFRTHNLILLNLVPVFLCVLLGIGCVTSIPRESLNQEVHTVVVEVPTEVNEMPSTMPTPEPTPYLEQETPEPISTPKPIEPSKVIPTATPQPTIVATQVPTPTKESDQGPTLPSLEILGPLNNSSFSSDSVIIYGTSDAKSKITINGSSSQIDSDGNFYSEVELITGINQFTIVSTSESNALTTKSINIFKTAPQTLFISITKPLNQTVITSSYVQISGLTSPDAKLKIDGVSVPITIERLDPANMIGLFDHMYLLGAGLNLININVTNESGDTIDKLISVIHSN
ncbi:MAG: hypothetical protein FI721_05125 [SAR202 cluster bacterium]|nr:hypothetical protein [SAR202 cluster bacterium]